MVLELQCRSAQGTEYSLAPVLEWEGLRLELKCLHVVVQGRTPSSVPRLLSLLQLWWETL